jgi:signal transduction histidine kinase
MKPSGLERTIRLLVVDDDEDDFFILKRLFASMKGVEYEVEWTPSSEEGIRIVKEARHDVYLIDYRIDARTGLDVLQEVEAINRPEPFILLTGVGDHAIERESLQLAASDYIVKKDLTSEALARTVYYALGRKEQEQQKIDQLVELNKTKDEFISIASHQLRTPATTVKQYIAMVADGFGGTLNEKQQTLLSKAYDSNERQLTIINDLLKVAQIDAGRMELVRRPIDMSAFLRGTAEDFRSIFAGAGQVLETDIQDGIAWNTDETALRMIIDNLLENAKKYSRKGATTTLCLELDDGTMSIAVVDEGVGVADPDKLFQKFSRIENELSTVVGGTGLGLYWAKSVAQLMGGSLHYERNDSGGSTFVLTFYDVK